jgi:hypothetical protein
MRSRTSSPVPRPPCLAAVLREGAAGAGCARSPGTSPTTTPTPPNQRHWRNCHAEDSEAVSDPWLRGDVRRRVVAIARNIGAKSWGATSSVPSAGPGRTTTGRAGGVTNPRSTPWCSSWPTTNARPSHSATRPSTSSTATWPPATVLAQAGGGAGQERPARRRGRIIREFLDADLVDTLHVAVSPLKLGSGARLWESPDELLDRFHLEVVPSPSGVTHHCSGGSDRSSGLTPSVVLPHGDALRRGSSSRA